MKKTFIFIFCLISISFYAQKQGNGGIPKGFKSKDILKNIDSRFFSEPDVQFLRSEDLQTDGTGTAPWRFGFNNYTNLNLSNSGTWVDLNNGDRIWFLKVTCEKALSVNLTFKNLEIPDGNQLYVYDESHDFILGAFTYNHIYKGQLGSELIPGNTVIVEYYVPRGNSIGYIEIGTVTHGYRTAEEFQDKAFGGSGSCNMNVNCADGLPWQQQRNSALMLVSGSNGFCSGALINNTLNDGKPYVLTANHCYSDPTNWIFRFNWQSVDCNNPASSPNFQSLSGSVLRARRTPSDFCLVEITGGLEGNTVPLSFQPYFSGWNNADGAPSATVSIHHPSGDIKKISFDDAPAVVSQGMGSTEPNSTWTVEWDRNTTTEGGSSGSPLFDQNHRIIGQLWGGGASCSNLSSPDYYGRVHSSWEPVGSNSTNQLKFWLDPNNSGAQFIDGYDPSNATPVQIDAAIANPQGVSGTFCGAEVTPSVTIQNNGQQSLTSAIINYGFDGNVNQIYNWSGNLPQWQSVNVILPTSSLTSGTHTFSANVVNPNLGQTDENANNNSVSSTFNVVIGGQSVQLNLALDCYGSETSWELQDSNSNAIYYGTGYPDDQPGPVNIDAWCLNEGCYTYVIMDSYGDGLLGGFWCGQDGSVSIVYQGDTLNQIPESAANFGNQTSLQFCIGSAGIEWMGLDDFVVYPNPFDDKIEVKIISSDAKELKLYDLTGKVLLTREIEGSTLNIDLGEGFSSGNYLVELIMENGRNYVKKLVKK